MGRSPIEVGTIPGSSDYQVCVGAGGGAPIYQAGCFAVQLNSDTTYLAIVSDATGEGLSPKILFPTLPASVVHLGCHLCF